MNQDVSCKPPWIGADSLSSVILLRDAVGNEFKTSNSSVVTSVIDEMKRTLDGKVKEVEEQPLKEGE